MLSFESPFNRPLPFYDICTVAAPIKGVETLKVDVADHIWLDTDFFSHFIPSL